MKKILALLIFIATIASCKKDNTPVAKNYTVEYKLTGTPLANTTLSGNISYVSKTSATASGSLSNNQWIATEGSWTLKAGDKVGFNAAIANLATYQATISVDGGVKVLQGGGQSFPVTTNIVVSYTVE
ncbi:MAG: hypothetical protein RLZZ595_10 [Bacteroidota bacterium]|jgi:hypothetical protein